MPGRGSFVGAFASTNLGDVSPNIMGPKCQKSGKPCDMLTSTCPDKDQCIASGPGKDMFESTKIIATRIYKGASKILKEKSGREITGPIDFVHQYIDMSKANATYYNPYTKNVENVRGCLPAMGYSFAAGTTDGPGSFEFKQGTITDNALWNVVRDFIAAPSKDDEECQAPKPILLATGRAVYPYEWQPKIVPTQIFVIGDLALAGLPGEFTTMSGRR
jgi:neutral ceramidase